MHPSETEDFIWVEEVIRGKKEVLVLMRGPMAIGSVELDSYEEKVAWTQAIAELNSTLGRSLPT